MIIQKAGTREVDLLNVQPVQTDSNSIEMNDETYGKSRVENETNCKNQTYKTSIKSQTDSQSDETDGNRLIDETNGKSQTDSDETICNSPEYLDYLYADVYQQLTVQRRLCSPFGRPERVKYRAVVANLTITLTNNDW
ncbi:hypothetical protein CHS0354_017490 [Potamilus streckersoni]|uniref:Uncharacterized protein n=1 Tax=Potamilus streckersoni TaxID=2493646 RepID=A0AAE0W347_9BIVA|nr:hypothetical protein CHS0354_017490 [Potamilus streckersoni]